MLNKEDQLVLYNVAKEAIKAKLLQKAIPSIALNNYAKSLTDIKCCFVTLTLHNELRGCIGALEPYQALVLDVCDHAIAAAFNDPRFPPLKAEEYNDIALEISVLDTPTPISFANEQDLLDQIQEGEDGLILEDGGHRGTFLPAVWESLPNKQDFWKHLKQKAGLPADHWSSTITVRRYRTQKIETPYSKLKN